MCTLVILRRPGHHWPVVIGANRDEMLNRPWRPPARHWPDRADVVAGLDELAGGSWLGINDHGLVAGVLNRMGSLGPDPDKRSRGELVLEALDHADAEAAAAALAALEPAAYRPFNLVVADNESAFWLRNLGDGARRGIDVEDIPEGVSMVTARDMNDAESPRIRRYLPQFRAAPAPDPDAETWESWEKLLADRTSAQGADPTEAMCIVTRGGFGTSSGSLIALPSTELAEFRPVWRFAGGRPDRVPFEKIVT